MSRPLQSLRFTYQHRARNADRARDVPHTRLKTDPKVSGDSPRRCFGIFFFGSRAMSKATEVQILEALRRIEQLLTTGPDEAFDLEQARQFLKCSRGYLYSLTSKRAIPFCRTAGRLRFSKQALTRWLLASPLPTADQLVATVQARKRPKPTAEICQN